MLVSAVLARAVTVIGEQATLSDAWFTAAEQLMFFNDAYREAYRAYLSVISGKKPIDTEATDSTVDGTQSYAVPDNTLLIKFLFYVAEDGTRSEVTLLEPNEIEEVYKVNSWAATKTATPQYAVRLRNKLLLYPIPDYSGANNLILYYLRNPIDKSADIPAELTTADTPSLIPTCFHHKLIYLIVWAYWAKASNFKTADYFMGLHQALLAEIHSEFNIDIKQPWRAKKDLFPPGFKSNNTNPETII